MGRRKLVLLIIFVFCVILSGSFLERGKISPKTEVDLKPTETRGKEIASPEDVSVKLSPDNPVLGTNTDLSNPERISARVIGVRDGDTIEVDLGRGLIKTVRYIGIDTPESVDPRKPVQCFAVEASNINKSLVQNRIVQLEKDISETDKYGRLLRYVYMDGMFINRYLVEEGFARASTYPPDVKYQEDLSASEEEARLSGKGLWGACQNPSSSSTTNRKSNSADDKDCSDFTTHNEAQGYFESKGGSSTNNVDRLDGSDHDGQVCETLP